jgi:hypothetical protein
MVHKDGWLGFRCVAETDNVMLSRDGAIPVRLLNGRGVSSEEGRNHPSHNVHRPKSISTHSRSQNYHPSRTASTFQLVPPFSPSTLLLTSLISRAPFESVMFSCLAMHLLQYSHVDIHPLAQSVPRSPSPPVTMRVPCSFRRLLLRSVCYGIATSCCSDNYRFPDLTSYLGSVAL